jgi:lactoylglutathione lyase
MKYERTGVILCTEKYNECVAFYSEVLELPILEVLDDKHSKLTVMSLGKDTYLMVETGGTAIPSGKNLNQNPVWFRFNVNNVEVAAQELIDKNIRVKIRKEVWGTVGDFMDPDGNICSLREEPSEKLSF